MVDPSHTARGRRGQPRAKLEGRRVKEKESKNFFFEKKAPRPGKQKTFGSLRAALAAPKPREADQKFFWLLFFQKK